MSQEPSKATFVTFYSFKGGVGRSMALINTAAILAGRGFRVLAIDLDLEAPGLSYLDPNAPDDRPSEEKPKPRPMQLGFVDLLIDAKQRGQDADLFRLTPSELASRYSQPYHIPEAFLKYPDGSLHVMPAGRLDSDYARRFDDLNLHGLYEEGLGEPLIRAFKKKFAEAGQYDYVLVDSRTGFSDEAGICTRDLADHLVILSGLNRQNVEGTCDFLRSLRAATDGRKSFQIILSPVPVGEDSLLDQREAAAKAAFEKAWGSDIDLSLQIPYHPRLALTEEPHIFRRRRGYLFEAYRAIEQHMLKLLGHTAPRLHGIAQTLQHRDYPAILRELRRSVRLDVTRAKLNDLAVIIVAGTIEPSLRGEAAREPTEATPALDEILSDEDGRALIEFLLDNLPLSGGLLLPRKLADVLLDHSLELAERLLRRLVAAAPGDADTLAAFASFLDENRDDKEQARVYYQRAVESAPNDAHLLGTFAVFLDERNGDSDRAETYYQRAIEADPNDAHNLGNYAAFLRLERGDRDGAEAYYKRAIAAEPNSARHLGAYAFFLDVERGDLSGAGAYYKRAIEADPEDANTLSNYGHLLVSIARLAEGENLLLSAFRHLRESDAATAAELCYAIWLTSKMQGHDEEGWERHFKFLIQQGFERFPWDFDRILDQAERVLPPDEFEYAKALASAFLDESKVAALDGYERWRALEPANPVGTR